MATDIETVDRETGEVMSMTEAPVALAVQLAQAELNQAVTTAKAFPRDLRRVQQNITALATLDEETAAESVYALPRGGKPIKGPSIRFAEIVASQFGNCHTGSRIVAVDRFEKVVIAEGVFFDLETGMKRTAQIRRKISGRDGRIFNDDMITVTGNAAASIAMREAILKGIPKALWRRAYEHCEKVIAGEVATLNERRTKAIAAFAVWGVKPEQIFAALEVENIDGIGLDELATLTAMHSAIKKGDETVEKYFPAHSDGEKAVEAARGTATKGTAGKLKDIGNSAGGEQKPADDPDKAAEGDEKGGKGKDKPKADPKPKTEDKAAQQPAQQGDGAAPGIADDNDASNQKAAPTDDEIEAAFKRGEKAKADGMSRRALPGEYREIEALASAWERGFDGE